MKNFDKDYKKLYRGIIHDLPIGTLVFVVKDDVVKVITINDRLLEFAQMTNPTISDKDIPWTKERITAILTDDLYIFVSPEDIDKVQSCMQETIKTGNSRTIFHLNGTEGPNAKWIMAMSSSKMINDQERIFYILFVDCTQTIVYERELLNNKQELMEKQNDLVNITKYDAMTEVCNRTSYNTLLENAYGRTLRDVGIIYADINGVKTANDEFGHQFGDAIINDFSFVLREFFDRKFIYRINGDEFLVIQNDIPSDKFTAKVQELNQLIATNNLASIGSYWQPRVTDLRQCVYQTELLMKIQKRKYYMETETLESKHRPMVLKNLVDDMANKRFVVYLQPKAKINSTKVIGAEALIRKIDKNGEVIAPYQFVPILEKELLISKVDFFVLEEVCKMLYRWQRDHKELVKISVNMSRVSMAENDFLPHILQICDKYQTNYKMIEFEITESTNTKDHNKMMEIVAKLAHLGFGVSLDDMGNDYSSIKMLTMDGIDTVKLDRSLVLQMESPKGISLMKYIIALCHELHKTCIAEGVESTEQMNVLQELHCDCYQGFWLDKPIPVQEFEKYLH